jgi:hypothetical protein
MNITITQTIAREPVTENVTIQLPAYTRIGKQYFAVYTDGDCVCVRYWPTINMYGISTEVNKDAFASGFTFITKEEFHAEFDTVKKYLSAKFDSLLLAEGGPATYDQMFADLKHDEAREVSHIAQEDLVTEPIEA